MGPGTHKLLMGLRVAVTLRGPDLHPSGLGTRLDINGIRLKKCPLLHYVPVAVQPTWLVVRARDGKRMGTFVQHIIPWVETTRHEDRCFVSTWYHIAGSYFM